MSGPDDGAAYGSAGRIPRLGDRAAWTEALEHVRHWWRLKAAWSRAAGWTEKRETVAAMAGHVRALERLGVLIPGAPMPSVEQWMRRDPDTCDPLPE